jgi:hypothetical protein
VNRIGALPAGDLIERLADVPAAGPLRLGYDHGLRSATLTELVDEPFMRDVISCTWATHLGVGDTPEARATVCLAALADVVARLLGVAEAIRCGVDAAWVIDPDDVALGYRPLCAPVAAVCLLRHDVRLARHPRDGQYHRADDTPASNWPVLDALIRAWCEDGDLDLDDTRRTLGL